MAFTRVDRQRIIDGYLAATGNNQFVPSEFIDWLGNHPEHEAHEWFFGQGDEAAAREYRIAMARQMASGLRIVARVNTMPEAASTVSVRVREFPALVSPVAGRKDGGGYQHFHPDDPEMVAELRRQGAVALRAWLARFGGVADVAGVNVTSIEEIAASLDGRVVDAA